MRRRHLATFVMVFWGFWMLVGFAGDAVEAAPARVALLHQAPELGQANVNIAMIEDLVEEAFLGGANIVVTPELATTGFSITRNQVLAALGFVSPYPELDNIAQLAMAHAGYVAVGIAEVSASGDVYNTVALLVGAQRKRGLSGWHERGNVPFEIFTTPYGDLALIICSDSYLPDWTRIAALKGADVLLLPANWWGSSGQERIWQTRARESGIWFVTANRWGMEVDTRYGFPFVYDMNDAPSAVISPDGSLQVLYRSEDEPTPANAILHYTLEVPSHRIGTAYNPTYSLAYRRPEAYGAIANSYYRPDLGNQMIPGLPPDGITGLAAMTCRPEPFAPAKNLATLRDLWATSATQADVLVLPGLGISSIPINRANPRWHRAGHWRELQAFVEENGLLLLVTTVLERDPSNGPSHGSGHRPDLGLPQSLLLIQPGQPPRLVRQIHDSLLAQGSGAEPVYIDLPHARVGVLTGRDALFPETATHLAKSGIDILAISSTAGTTAPMTDDDVFHYFWTPAALQNLWRTRTNHVFHLAASDWTGHGVTIENTGGFIGRLQEIDGATPLSVFDVLTSSDPFSFDSVRIKFLNAYYSFDLDTLLGSAH